MNQHGIAPRLLAGLALLAGLGFTAPARGGMITTSATFDAFGPVSLDRFDTLGGTRTLTAVDIDYTINPLTIFLFGENFRPTPIVTTVTIGGSVTFTGPPSAGFTFPVNRILMYDLGPSDGVPNSGPDFFEDPVSFLFSGSRVGVPDDFVGTGTFTLLVGGGGPIGFNPEVTRPSSFPASVAGRVDVTYTFESASAVPEPSSLALLGLGACTLGGYAWRRRRTRGSPAG